ncbi:MAG: hypothetical protein NZ530_02485 [Thermodesulfobacteriaceae bacterium]|nr:hypothetical protein [Thermodesulfobacteriaceae bacterium]MCX8041351.1 hypothetical protein [Thermodesulfobacteriaceae bacterium]
MAFFICSIVIFYCGSRVSKYGDILAEKTRLGGTWIGLALVASVTSLPELFTGISAVTYVDAPDIAISNVLGACAYNLLLLAMLDVLHVKAPLSSKLHIGHIISAASGILLLSIVSLSLLLRKIIIPLGWIGPYSLVIIFVYFSTIRMLYSYEKRRYTHYLKEKVIKLQYEDISTKSALFYYLINAIGVIMAALFLPKIGVNLAKETGLSQTFVGNIFIALATTLPEFVVSFAAVKRGAIDLGIGNILGSVIFNILILAIDDFFYLKGALLNSEDYRHITSALFVISMLGTFIIGIIYRTEKKAFPMAWDSLIIALTFLIYVMLLY